ncbi:exosortase family protein XrtF [Bizionia argentinensis JUB59]|uniref:Exosortase family protein XrtF n=1 Tax=Bizionia argentinensis JUB59 TaxID=1046627 RepID=G2EDH3_9FLAO|nr:exosortase family protein XrtF [Bizionia argentinensis]EGV43512.2 exosortase family protein XrtF [Bizionia argentinensis JUB59]
MKKLLLKYKSVIKFILTFLAVYVVLSFSYKLYLDLSTGTDYYPDYVTHAVAQQTAHLLNTWGYHSQVLPHLDEPTMKLILNGKYIARVIEGCNSVSVIILFVAFILAFSGKFKVTVIYILSGSVFIYVVNLIRIVLLSIGLYHYPQHEAILHTVIFPAIIYGLVCFLWLVWVNRFSKIATNK